MIYVLLNNTTFEPFYVGKCVDMHKRLNLHKVPGRKEVIPVVLDRDERLSERQWYDLLTAEGHTLQQHRKGTRTRTTEDRRLNWRRRIHEKQEQMLRKKLY